MFEISRYTRPHVITVHTSVLCVEPVYFTSFNEHSATRFSHTWTIIFSLPALFKKPTTGHEEQHAVRKWLWVASYKFSNTGQNFTKLGMKFMIVEYIPRPSYF
jgi:hypothetical protein